MRGNEAQDSINIWLQVAMACRESNVSLILVLSEIIGHLPTMAAFEIANDPEAFGWSRRLKLAIVDLNNEARPDSLFGENVAVNRGFNLKIFENEPEARAWLFETQ